MISTNLRLLPVAILLASSLFLLITTSVLASAQSPSEPTKDRLLLDLIPKHVPIKVKIKKEKEESFKDLRNEHWVRELEVEVTNTGDKPIYFLDLALVTNVAAGVNLVLNDADDAQGNRLGLVLRYGRSALGDITSTAAADDLPIKPGETVILTIHPGEVGGWELSVRDGNHPQPTRLQLIFQQLSFGDGTGLSGGEGSPYPPRR